MTEPVTVGPATLIQGDALEVLRTLPGESVHCVVTSPPYWGLRDYGVEGMIGLEPTFQEWLDKMVAVCEEVRRVLRRDGTFWLNVGDCYAQTGSGIGQDNSATSSEKPYDGFRDAKYLHQRNPKTTGGTFKPKDLLLMPARLAIALQAAGWWVRSEIVWAKPNPMPESVTDRPTSAHEKIYLLTRSAKYYYDADAVREPLLRPEELTREHPAVFGGRLKHSGIDNRKYSGNEYKGELSGRNQRNVWTIATQPYAAAHFATFPEELPRRCILAGTSERGVCSACGSPWVRVTETPDWYKDLDGHKMKSGTLEAGVNVGFGAKKDSCSKPVKTLGWEASCKCGAPTVPATVLDIFCGSGTTGLVACQLRRQFIGIELNPDYVTLARRRIEPEVGQGKLSL